MPALAKHTLGRTGLNVTALGYGAMELRGPGGGRGRPVTEDQAKAVLNAVLDSGITFIDTSVDYGASEELIGTFIAHRRHEYVLASKCGCWAGASAPPPTADGRFPHVFTKENIVAGVDQSLRRMKTDHLDIVQVHASPSRADLEREDVPGTLQALKREGKVRWVGMSGTIPNLANHIAMGVFDVFQVPYSCLQREHEDLVTRAAKAGAGIIIRGGAARGVPSGEKNERVIGWTNPADPMGLWERAKLDDLLNGMTRMEFVVRFTLSHPDMGTNIVDTINPDHLRANVAAAVKGPLPASVLAEAKQRLAAAGAVPAATAGGR